MEISVEELSRIVTSLGGPAAAPGATKDHRRATRVDRQAQMAITPIVNGRPRTSVTVRVKNFSSRGIGFVRDKRMLPGSQFLIRMTREDMAPIEMLCTVVHCAQQSQKIWAVGAEFTCVAPTAQADNLSEADRIRQSMLG